MKLDLSSLRVGVVTAVIVGLGIGTSNGQSPESDPPQTAWGAPDLQGVWTSGTLTDLERPEEYAGQAFLS